MQIATQTLRLVGPNVSDPRRDGQPDEDNAAVYHLNKGSTVKINDAGQPYSGKNIIAFWYCPVRFAANLAKCDGYFGPGRDGGGFHWHAGYGTDDLVVSVKLFVLYT